MNKNKLFQACHDITLEVMQNLERGQTYPLIYSYELYRYDNLNGADERVVVRDSEQDILIVNMHGEDVRFTDIYGLS